jgi:RHS repeat-associated protein
MLDSVGLVHMNGRVYDPTLGRFLSADTVVQSLAATQSVNPYSYAWNDPLRYVDSNGHSLLGDLIGAIVGLAIIIFAPEIGLPAIGTAGSVTTAVVAGFVGSFVGAAISTGNLGAAFMAGILGGITGFAFYGAGSFATWASNGSKVWLYADGVLAHAAVGCGSAMMSGGICGRGALSAAVAEAAGPLENRAAQWGGLAAGTVAAGVVGGLAARTVNGSFDDGFSVGAAGYLFNKLFHQNGKLWAVKPTADEMAAHYANGTGETVYRRGDDVDLTDYAAGQFDKPVGTVIDVQPNSASLAAALVNWAAHVLEPGPLTDSFIYGSIGSSTILAGGLIQLGPDRFNFDMEGRGSRDWETALQHSTLGHGLPGKNFVTIFVGPTPIPKFTQGPFTPTVP